MNPLDLPSRPSTVSLPGRTTFRAHAVREMLIPAQLSIISERTGLLRKAGRRMDSVLPDGPVALEQPVRIQLNVGVADLDEIAHVADIGSLASAPPQVCHHHG